MTRRPDGALERDVLAVLWGAERALLPAEVNERIGGGHAYTSVATVLTRLHTKGLVERQAVGRGFAYTTVYDESELAARRIGEVLTSSSDRSKVLARFVGGLSTRDAAVLRRMLDEGQR